MNFHTRPDTDVDQFAGCLVGQSLADALGFVVEGASPEVCAAYVDSALRPRRLTKRHTRGRYPLGQYSDDSQLARELASSLVARGGFDPSDYAARIAALFVEDRIVGRGRATEQAAYRIADGTPWDVPALAAIRAPGAQNTRIAAHLEPRPDAAVPVVADLASSHHHSIELGTAGACVEHGEMDSRVCQVHRIGRGRFRVPSEMAGMAYRHAIERIHYDRRVGRRRQRGRSISNRMEPMRSFSSSMRLRRISFRDVQRRAHAITANSTTPGRQPRGA